MVYYFLFLEKSGWSLSIFFSFSTLALLKLRFLRKSYLRQALAVQTVKFLKLSTLLAEERRVIGKCIYNFFYVFVSVISIGNPNKIFDIYWISCFQIFIIPSGGLCSCDSYISLNLRNERTSLNFIRIHR